MPAASSIGPPRLASARIQCAKCRLATTAELARIDAVKTLIVQAEAFYAMGYITGPARQDNAIARLREALRLDPNNADALRLLSLAATRLASAAQDAYHAGMVEEGLRYLDLALTVTPGIGRWREMRERWQADMEGAQRPSL